MTEEELKDLIDAFEDEHDYDGIHEVMIDFLDFFKNKYKKQ